MSILDEIISDSVEKIQESDIQNLEDFLSDNFDGPLSALGAMVFVGSLIVPNPVVFLEAMRTFTESALDAMEESDDPLTEAAVIECFGGIESAKDWN